MMTNEHRTIIGNEMSSHKFIEQVHMLAEKFSVEVVDITVKDRHGWTIEKSGSQTRKNIYEPKEEPK